MKPAFGERAVVRRATRADASVPGQAYDPIRSPVPTVIRESAAPSLPTRKRARGGG
jgi:hypothetical protein